MNSKAIRKQLFAAVAMVLVAAVALGSSTYAWFANNNVVTAYGMSVQAAAQGGIEIKYKTATVTPTGSATTAYSTTANAALPTTSLFPTSTAAKVSDGSITDWYYAVAAVRDNHTAKSDTYVTMGTVQSKYTFSNGRLSYDGAYTGAKAAPVGDYYIATTFSIASVNESKTATDLKVKDVTVSATGSATTALDKSLRVAVVCGENAVIYAPCYEASVTYTVADSTTGTPSTPGSITTQTVNEVATPKTVSVTALGTGTESRVIASSVGTETTPTDVVVYIYYEGEDTNHMTHNLAASIDTLSVSLDFAATV